MSRYDVAFLVARVFALVMFVIILENAPYLWGFVFQILGDPNPGTSSGIFGTIILFLLLLIFSAAIWHKAGWLAKHLLPKSEVKSEPPASLYEWQNAAMTIIGFWILLHAFPNCLILLSRIPDGQEDRVAAGAWAGNFSRATFQLLMSVAFILIPHKITNGLTRLRTKY